MPLKLHPLISFSKLYRHIRLHSYLPIKLISISCILFDFSTKPKIYQPLLLTQSRYSLCQLELNQNEWNKRKKKLRNQKKKKVKKNENEKKEKRKKTSQWSLHWRSIPAANCWNQIYRMNSHDGSPTSTSAALFHILLVIPLRDTTRSHDVTCADKRGSWIVPIVGVRVPAGTRDRHIGSRLFRATPCVCVAMRATHLLLNKVVSLLPCLLFLFFFFLFIYLCHSTIFSLSLWISFLSFLFF